MNRRQQETEPQNPNLIKQVRTHLTTGRFGWIEL